MHGVKFTWGLILVGLVLSGSCTDSTPLMVCAMEPQVDQSVYDDGFRVDSATIDVVFNLTPAERLLAVEAQPVFGTRPHQQRARLHFDPVFDSFGHGRGDRSHRCGA